jgi:hypothetical protein
LISTCGSCWIKCTTTTIEITVEDPFECLSVPESDDTRKIQFTKKKRKGRKRKKSKAKKSNDVSPSPCAPEPKEEEKESFHSIQEEQNREENSSRVINILRKEVEDAHNEIKKLKDHNRAKVTELEQIWGKKISIINEKEGVSKAAASKNGTAKAQGG